MKQMHTMRKTIVLLLSALLLTSCGLLRPVDAEEKVPAETGAPVQDAETEAAVQTEENELSSAALTFDSILADYEARQNGSKEEKADNKPEEPE
ncbi:MAG: hypothetical protein J6V24_12335, partial [Clostridia bacterium]|nr:hypothetical protein [Clostridia bacterium]